MGARRAQFERTHNAVSFDAPVRATFCLSNDLDPWMTLSMRPAPGSAAAPPPPSPKWEGGGTAPRVGAPPPRRLIVRICLRIRARNG